MGRTSSSLFGRAMSSISLKIAVVLKELCSFAGLYTRIEETRAFQEAFPDCNLRPDMSIYNYHYHKVVADVSVTHPIPISSSTVLSRNAALQPCRAAEKARRRKIAKYSTVSDANNLEFLPIIFETTGKMHPETEIFVKEILQKACEDIPLVHHSVLHSF